MSNLCICQSGKVFMHCCDRFLNQEQHARTPVQLMRSRYSAFALGGYGDYLLATWSARQSTAMSAAELSFKSTNWVDLEIITKSQKGNQGFVEFKAFYLGANGKRSEHHEKSEFERVKGRWFYVNGEML